MAYRGTPRSANIAQTALRGAESRYFAPMMASGGVLGSSASPRVSGGSERLLRPGGSDGWSMGCRRQPESGGVGMSDQCKESDG